MAYARASKALGQCDRCGFSYKLNKLRYEIEDSKRNGMRVCGRSNRNHNSHISRRSSSDRKQSDRSSSHGRDNNHTDQ